MDIKFTVILPVYKKVDFKTFCKSFDSLIKQTLIPNEIIVVLDGPVKGNIINYINEKKKFYKFLRLIIFPINKGLGPVLKIATKLSSYEYIVRCDADDISKPERFELQMKFLNKNKDIDVLGSNVYEIENNRIVSKKKVDHLHEKIIKKIYFRNPINHSSVIFKKKTILKSGNYEDVKYFEDYFLWMKVFAHNGKFHNLENYLVNMNIDDQFFKRRSGLDYSKFYFNFLIKLRSRNLISMTNFILNLMLRLIIILMPVFLVKRIYKNILRN